MWVIIQTTPQGQVRAIEHLEANGFEVYCPMETVWKRTRRNKSKIQRPLLVGYLFAKTDRADVHAANRLDGVRGTIVPNMSDANFARAIRALADQELAGAFDKTEEKRDRFTAGRKVVIKTEGPLKDQIGVVVNAAKNGDVRVVLNAMLKWETTQHIDDLEVAA